MESTLVIFCRHGETDWNKSGRCQGISDIPLNENGREQGRQLAEGLKGRGVTAVWTSELCRARETGSFIATAAGAQTFTDERLRERCQGVFEGKTGPEQKQQYPEFYSAKQEGTTLPVEAGVEAAEDVRVRVEAALFDIADMHAGQTVAIVGHGGTMKALLNVHALNASTTTISVGPGRVWRMIEANSVTHLKDAPCKRASQILLLAEEAETAEKEEKIETETCCSGAETSAS